LQFFPGSAHNFWYIDWTMERAQNFTLVTTNFDLDHNSNLHGSNVSFAVSFTTGLCGVMTVVGYNVGYYCFQTRNHSENWSA